MHASFFISPSVLLINHSDQMISDERLAKIESLVNASLNEDRVPAKVRFWLMAFHRK